MIKSISQKIPIHLLYVPTIFCNLGCNYCYLGSLTDKTLSRKELQQSIDTLKFAINKFTNDSTVPFNVSLHGGEVTTLPKDNLAQLFEIIRNYYRTNKSLLNQIGFKKENPHVKTNLYNFDKLYDLFVENRVSISASIDLPLELHEKHRTTKQGRSTLKRTLDNLALLATYPYKKKISATLFEPHVNATDQIISDIWHIHKEVKFDMNNFNFMFGFESKMNDEKFNQQPLMNAKAVSDKVMVTFYNKMKEAFLNTELEAGFKKHWFDEFTPSYCTNAVNCGEKFYLLQSDGKVYSCVRGQSNEHFYYGNIFENSVEEIMQSGSLKISAVHRKEKLHADCQSCEYLHLCHTGCAYVKDEQGSGKSYSCLLQKAIYKDYPNLYKPLVTKQAKKRNLVEYYSAMHPNLLLQEMHNNPDANKEKSFLFPNDFYQEKNKLEEIITNDSVLLHLYAKDNFFLTLNDEKFLVESQILKNERPILNFSQQENIRLFIRKSIFTINIKERVRNTLYIQLLRDTKVVYGDEKREKQEHILTLQLFVNMLTESEKHPLFYEYDIGKLLNLHQDYFIDSVLNNLLVTTQALRDYHYQKQKDNAFYHLQALNLPFQNIEFYWTKSAD